MIARFKMNAPNQDFERRRVSIVSTLSEGVDSGYIELEVSTKIQAPQETRLDSRSFRLLRSMELHSRALIASDLRESSIQYLSLSTFPVRFSKSILELRLDHNKISDVDSSLFESLPNLKILDLSHNRLTRICNRLPLRLEKLILSHNRIRAVEAVAQLQHLLELDLGYNSIKTTLQLRALSLLGTYFSCVFLVRE